MERKPFGPLKALSKRHAATFSILKATHCGHEKPLGMPSEDNMALKDVLLDELRDMYSAENQLVKALPKLAKSCHQPKIKSLFTAHLAETKGQSRTS